MERLSVKLKKSRDMKIKVEAEGTATPGYREAVEELESIVAKIEDPSTKIEEISSLVKRAMNLAQICKKELGRYREEIDNLQKEQDGRA